MATEQMDGFWRRPRWSTGAVALFAAAVLVIGVAATLLVAGGDDGDGSAAPSTTSSPATSTSSTATTVPSSTSSPTAVTTTTIPTVPGDVTTAVWPFAASSTRYLDPRDAARGFAVDYLGFEDPVIGEFQQGDARSGEVEIRPRPDASVTTVLVRQLGADDTWWVLGAATADIQITAPDALASISSPVRLRGTSTAFEAVVLVEIREDGNPRPLVETFVMGGSMGELGPFDAAVDFGWHTADAGAIVLYTLSMEDGRIWNASVLRIRFEPPPPPVVSCGEALPARPAPGPEEMVVTVYFSCDADPEGDPVPLYRLVPESPAVLRASLVELLAGPTAEERAAGVTSWFSEATAGMLSDVRLDAEGNAVVDFGDLRPVIPNASSSFGSGVLLRQLDATVFQFASVRSVIYRIEGNCEVFTAWLQFSGCEPRIRAS